MGKDEGYDKIQFLATLYDYACMFKVCFTYLDKYQNIID